MSAPAPPAAGASVREAGACEVAVLAELSRRCFGPAEAAAFAGSPWSARSLAEILALPGAFALLAAEVGQPVGFLLAQSLFEDCEILTLGVLAERRRAGHGGRLLGAAAAAAERRGATRLLLEVAEGNAAARAFYCAHGFLETGRRRNYYLTTSGGRVDAVICACALGPAPSSRD